MYIDKIYTKLYSERNWNGLDQLVNEIKSFARKDYKGLSNDEQSLLRGLRNQAAKDLNKKRKFKFDFYDDRSDKYDKLMLDTDRTVNAIRNHMIESKNDFINEKANELNTSNEGPRPESNAYERLMNRLGYNDPLYKKQEKISDWIDKKNSLRDKIGYVPSHYDSRLGQLVYDAN